MLACSKILLFVAKMKLFGSQFSWPLLKPHESHKHSINVRKSILLPLESRRSFIQCAGILSKYNFRCVAAMLWTRCIGYSSVKNKLSYNPDSLFERKQKHYHSENFWQQVLSLPQKLRPLANPQDSILFTVEYKTWVPISWLLWHFNKRIFSKLYRQLGNGDCSSENQEKGFIKSTWHWRKVGSLY